MRQCVGNVGQVSLSLTTWHNGTGLVCPCSATFSTFTASLSTLHFLVREDTATGKACQGDHSMMIMVTGAAMPENATRLQTVGSCLENQPIYRRTNTSLEGGARRVGSHKHSIVYDTRSAEIDSLSVLGCVSCLISYPCFDSLMFIETHERKTCRVEVSPYLSLSLL